MAGRMLWLADVARDAGLEVEEVDGWKTRGRPEMEPRGIINHHTAGAATGDLPSLNVLVNGRADLSGPLCHYGLGRSGKVYVIAAGKANHAGRGRWDCDEHLTHSGQMIGIEAEHTGSSKDPWPEEQLEAYKVLDAAILRHLGRPVDAVCAHREWAEPPGRKPDPVGIDMDPWRAEVEEIMRRLDGEPAAVAAAADVVVTGEAPGVDPLFADAWEWASGAGVFSEHTKPDSVVTSEELAVFLRRYHTKVVRPLLEDGD